MGGGGGGCQPQQRRIGRQLRGRYARVPSRRLRRRANTPGRLFFGLAAPRRVNITSLPRPSRTVGSRPCSGISWWVHGRRTARFACDIASPGTHCEIRIGSDGNSPDRAAGLGGLGRPQTARGDRATGLPHAGFGRGRPSRDGDPRVPSARARLLADRDGEGPGEAGAWVRPAGGGRLWGREKENPAHEGPGGLGNKYSQGEIPYQRGGFESPLT
jgi:hypothetical protein